MVAQKILKILTLLVLRKQKPGIITVTGSIGKTSTKEGIFFALNPLGKVGRSAKNHNNEIGVPLTAALWEKSSPGKNIWQWFLLSFRLFHFAFFKNKRYPAWLIFEIAADKKGDLNYLMKMFPKQLLRGAVLTAVSPVHLEFFHTIEAIFEEKTTPFKFIGPDGFILLNKDNCDFKKIARIFTNKNIISYGFTDDADVQGFDFQIQEQGINFKIKTKKGVFDFLLKEAVSEYQCYPILAGVATAIEMGVDLNLCLKSLNEKPALPGRMRLIKGINNSLLIDDTYNSSPQACAYALMALHKIQGKKRKIAVLGSMLELGKESPELHRQIGKIVNELGIDILVTFGKEGKEISNRAIHFKDHQSAVDYLRKTIKEGDIALVKGSQGVRMEKITKGIMLHPDQAQELLVRQGKEWK